MSDVIQVNPLVFGGNGGVEIPFMTKLWENPDPTASFASQTINLASSDYDFIEIEFAYNNSAVSARNTLLLGKLQQGVLTIVTASGGTGSVANVRPVGLTSDTELSFGVGYTQQGTATRVTDNTACIPITVYGIKKSYNIEDVAIANVSTSATKCIMSDNVTTVEQAIDKQAGYIGPTETNLYMSSSWTSTDPDVNTTASYDGYLLFAFSIYNCGGGAITTNGLRLVVNGILVASVISQGASSQNNASNTAIIPVKKGDSIKLTLVSGTINGTLRLYSKRN